MKLALHHAGLCFAILQCSSPALACPAPFECAQVFRRPAASVDLLEPALFHDMPGYLHKVQHQDRLTEAYVRGLGDLEELKRVLLKVREACEADKNCATPSPDPEHIVERSPMQGPTK